jgi:arylsulfatase A-like enzyme
MNLRTRYIATFIVAGTIISTVYTTAVTAAPQRPNILFIMSDDHAYQAIGAYGSKVNKTPNIDRIAREGMRFDRAFVTNSICGPARAVIMTGKYSHLNGFVRNGNTFNGEQQTVSKLLQQSGYQTAVVGKWHLKSTPIGFDHYHILIGQGPYYNPTMKTPTGNVKHVGYTTEIITDEALKYLKDVRDPKQPFFLMYQHKAPHRNWQPSETHISKYDGQTIPEPATLYDDYQGRSSAASKQAMTVATHLTRNDLKLVPQRGLTEQQTEYWNKAYGPKNEAFEKANLTGKKLIQWKYQRYVKDYLRCIDSVDDNVGRILDYLDESGLADNTIVIYTSDQGWYLGEHGWYDKRWMYEESFRTPLIVRWPQHIKPGSTNSDLVMNIDFAETFLDIAGAKIPADMQGQSLKPVFADQTPADWRTSVYYHYYEFPGAHSVAKHYGVRTDRYKLINFYENKEWEMFDLQTDPHELNSVHDNPQYQEVRKRMEAELQKLRAQYEDDGSVIDFGSVQAKNVKTQLVRRFRFGDFDNNQPSPHGTAITLDGKTAVFAAETSGRWNPEYKPFTIGAWIRPAKATGVIAAHGGESIGYSFGLQEGTIALSIRNGGVLTTAIGPSVQNDIWSNVVAILNRQGTVDFIVNGVTTETDTKVDFLHGAPADGFNLGQDNGSFVGEYNATNGFQGQLADFRLWWGIPEKEVLQIWAKTK